MTATSTADLRSRLLAGLPVTGRRMELADVSTAILEGGSGPPLVLLHGPAANATHWAPVIPGLAFDHHVIVPDLPDHGESVAAGGPPDADGTLAWLEELIARCCDEPPTLIGHALGGAIAARFAAQRGDRLSALVLVDSLGLAPLNLPPAFAAALHEFVADPTDATHDALWQHCAHDLPRLRDRMGERWETFRTYNVGLVRSTRTRSALGALMEQFGVTAIPPADLESIRTPTTLIWGRHDDAIQLTVAAAASARYGWRLEVIEDCADDPPVEQPEALVQALRAAMGAGYVQPLRRRLRGSALLPGDPGFVDATLLWNGLVSKHPAVVVQPAGAADVAATVDLAREHGLAVSVRGGGHHIAGTALANDGVTIDMSPLRGIVVDRDARTVTVQPGCTLGEVDRATQLHGLATPLGFVSEVGVAGLTLGGGLGYLTRRFGWTVDNLLEVEIVTADGRVRRASRDEHADLFWAIRGAGANLGVVTSLTLRLHEVGPIVYGGLIAWPFHRAEEILAAYRDITAGAPRELAVWLNLLRAPAAPFVPERWHGELVAAMCVCFSGDLADADAVLRPIRSLGDPVVDLLAQRPYTEVQSYLDDAEPKGDHYYWKADYAAELGDGLLALWRELAAECPIPRAQMGILHLGGALNERDRDDGAVGNRDARYALGAIGIWDPGTPGAEAFPRWIRQAWARFSGFSTGGTYVNFQTADEGEYRVRAAYGENFERLGDVKRRYDPDNVFRSNRNVRPAPDYRSTQKTTTAY